MLWRAVCRNTYSALNALAGHYNSFGATAPIPKKRLERLTKVSSSRAAGDSAVLCNHTNFFGKQPPHSAPPASHVYFVTRAPAAVAAVLQELADAELLLTRGR